MQIPILYWAQVTSVHGTMIPVLFFHPTLEFLSWIRQRGNTRIPVDIHGTGDLYDGKQWVTVDQVTQVGSCPPNYNHESPIYALMLVHSSFTIYPHRPGSFRLLG